MQTKEIVAWVVIALMVVIPQVYAVPEWAPKEAKIQERIAEIETIVTQVRHEIPQYYPEAKIAPFTDKQIATNIDAYEQEFFKYRSDKKEFEPETVEWNAYRLLTTTLEQLPNWEQLFIMYEAIHSMTPENMSQMGKIVYEVVEVDYSKVIFGGRLPETFITPEIGQRLLGIDDTPNPYCDLVTEEYMQNGGICHDRKDASETTGLYTCNDFTHVKNWTECKDATEVNQK